MRIGITQGTAGVTGGQLLVYAAKVGLSGTEPFIGDTDSPYYRWTRDDFDQFTTVANQLGVCVPSVAVGLFNHDSSLIDRERSAQAIEIVTRSLEFTAGVGAGIMMLCTYLESHPKTSQSKAALVNVIHEVEATARNLNVTIALESPLAANELVQLVDGIESDLVGVYFDVGNAVALGFDPVEEIKTLGRRITAVHIKDAVDQLGSLHLGQGVLDLEAACTALEQIGYDDWLMLETPGPPGPPDSESSNHVKLQEDIKCCLGVLIRQLACKDEVPLQQVVHHEG